MKEILNSLLEWVSLYSANILFSILIVIIYFGFRTLIKPKIESYIDRDQLNRETLQTALFSLNLFSGILSLIVILFVWGFNFKVLFAFSTGLIAITGVALFANWSILSNVTAFFILLIHKSYRAGNYIRIIDLDNYIEGQIVEINLFNTRLLTRDNETMIYPNNLLVARPIMINPKSRYDSIGKTEVFKQMQETEEK